MKQDNKQDMIYNLNNIKMDDWKDAEDRKYTIKSNKLLGYIFKKMKFKCKDCTDCCCGHCGENVGYYRNNYWDKKRFFWFKDRILKVLEQKGSDKWNGFHNPKKGCMLPREIRSITCSNYIGENYKCVPIQFHDIYFVLKETLKHMNREITGEIENRYYELANIARVVSQINYCKIKEEDLKDFKDEELDKLMGD